MPRDDIHSDWRRWIATAAADTAPAPRTVRALPFADHLLLSGFRLSVVALQQKTGRPAILEAHYAHQGIRGVALDVFNALRIVGALAQRPVAIACVYYQGVSADELALMNVVSAVQHGEDARAGALLSAWLPADGVGMVMPHIRAAASGFALGGLFLTPAFATPE